MSFSPAIDKSHLKPAEKLHRQSSLRRGLNPARYKYYMELKAISDDVLMDEMAVEFEIKKEIP